MEYKNSLKSMLATFIFANILLVTGCKVTTGKPGDYNEQQNEMNDMVTIPSQELAELKESASQWEQAEPGVQRLLLIEDDLNVLITQLNTVVKKEETKTTAPTKQEVSAIVKPEPAPKEMQSKVLPAFALQVASVTQPAQLNKKMIELKKKHPTLFSGNIIANVEKVDIQGLTFYRLKVGAYKSKSNASAACTKLKSQQVDCIVVNYTDNIFTVN